MRVIGIDPGYDRLGVAVLERRSGKDTLIISTCIETDTTTTLPERLHQLRTALLEIIAKQKPTALAIETLFFNKNTKTAIAVAEARGVILEAGITAGCTIIELSPQQVKVATTGYGNSDKAAVTAMVKRLVVGAPERGLDDEYDAIAVGITALAHHR